MAENERSEQELVGLTDLPNELSRRGREVWLAGLGALARVEEEGENIFRDLVKRGEDVEARGREQIEATMDRLMEQQRGATQAVSEAAQSVERTVSNTLTDTLGRMGMPTRSEVEELSGKVSQLSEKLDALSAAIEARKEAAEAAVYHVRPHEEGWAVHREGAERATSVHETKQEALEAGRDEAKNHAPSRLIVHKQDGSVQETFTYEEVA